MKIGFIGCGQDDHSSLEPFDKRFSIFGSPGLFADSKHLRAFMDGPVGQGLFNDYLQSQGVRVVAYFDEGIRNVWLTNKEAKTLEDFRGLKIRVPEVPVYVAIFMPLIIIVGILSGVFTATEAGAVGAFYGFAIGLIYREVGIRDLPRILMSTGKTTAKVMFVISSAMLFGWILASVQFTQKLTTWLFSLSSDPMALFFLILGFLLVLGCFMVDAAIITLCTPLFIPIIRQMGIDPIHFGVVMCMMTTTGGVTPPVGNLLFIACGIGDVSFVRAIRYLMPFLIALLASILICALVPSIVTFIPNLVMGP